MSADDRPDRRPDRRKEPPFPEGENPYVPPTYYLLFIALLALVIAATFL